MKKTSKKALKITLISVGIIALFVIGYFGLSQNLNYPGTTPLPAHIIVSASSSSSCDPNSPYGKAISGYKYFSNVVILNSNAEYDALQDDNSFRLSSVNRGGSTTDPMDFELSKGLVPNVMCDGSKDCKYGFTSETWELIGDKCFVVPETVMVYEFKDNECTLISILSDEDMSNRYDELDDCEENIEEPEEPEEPVECNIDSDCTSICRDKIPTCKDNSCFCAGEPIVIVKETPIYFYIIPMVVFGLIALIIWQLRKKPRRKR